MTRIENKRGRGNKENGQKKLSQKGEELQALRQAYRKAKTSLDRQSHNEFMQECLATGKTPKGLRVPVKCHTLLPHYSDVEERFQVTKCRAEVEFGSHLVHHHAQAVPRLIRELEVIGRAEREALKIATSQERAQHLEIKEKMDANVRIKQEKLAKKKKAKKEALATERPPSKKAKKAQKQGEGLGGASNPPSRPRNRRTVLERTQQSI